MYRLFVLPALLAALAAKANAVELFTNFHYGEHVGFPSMEVPVSIYGGWGTPGWNCNAIGKVPVPSGLPPAFPTGCNPHLAGCNYCDSVWSGYQQRAFHSRVNTRWLYGNHRPMPPGAAMPAMEMDADSYPYYDDEPSADQRIVPSVVRPQHGSAPHVTPTPGTPHEATPSNDRPAPRTTSRRVKVQGA